MKINENDRINSVISMQNIKASEKSKALPSEDESVPSERNYDRYIPGDNDESIGLYSMEYDDEGNPAISFDAPKEKKPDEPEGDKSEKAESCTGNTDKVDAEIKRLKEKQKQLEQKLMSADDEKKKKLIEQQLAAIESELIQKDNDSYRRGHTVFS